MKEAKLKERQSQFTSSLSSDEEVSTRRSQNSKKNVIVPQKNIFFDKKKINSIKDKNISSKSTSKGESKLKCQTQQKTILNKSVNHGLEITSICNSDKSLYSQESILLQTKRIDNVGKTNSKNTVSETHSMGLVDKNHDWFEAINKKLDLIVEILKNKETFEVAVQKSFIDVLSELHTIKKYVKYDDNHKNTENSSVLEDFPIQTENEVFIFMDKLKESEFKKDIVRTFLILK